MFLFSCFRCNCHSDSFPRFKSIHGIFPHIVHIVVGKSTNGYVFFASSGPVNQNPVRGSTSQIFSDSRLLLVVLEKWKIRKYFMMNLEFFLHEQLSDTHQ